jgi:hypothetical protein
VVQWLKKAVTEDIRAADGQKVRDPIENLHADIEKFGDAAVWQISDPGFRGQ